jgi:alginate O-acetyltransferase complex protein AlgI
MSFNSVEYIIFLFFVFAIYLFLSRSKQNLLLLFASYFFYACWDWRFLGLIIASTTFDFYFAKIIATQNCQQKKKRLLIISIIINLSVLVTFKYFNFFVDSLGELLAFFFLKNPIPELGIILPVGISFYTFQTLSYTIDVYRNKIKPCDKLTDFALYISFFPQLVAGPIERAEDFLPQVLNKRRIISEEISKGFYLICWGLFLKIFVADNLAIIVNQVFSESADLTGPMVLIGSYCFAFQIYCDFNGYSTIARGSAKILGFNLTKNFNFPYMATNVRDFWRRWHISLSTWLRDYLYIPLGGSNDGKLKTARNLIITMGLGGLWHGAAWNFVVWGLYHGVLLAVNNLLLTKSVKLFGTEKVHKVLKQIVFFHIICFGWLIFRCQNMNHLEKLTHSLFSEWSILSILEEKYRFYNLVFFTFPVIILEFISWKKNEEYVAFIFPTYLRAILYVIFFYLMIFFTNHNNHEFIYFQF